MCNLRVALIILTMLFVGCEGTEIIPENKDILDQENEADVLLELYNEIQQLSKSVSCEDVSDWNFTAIGSKPCGGPWGYIGYSSKIDTVHFLSRVALYTQQQAVYNRKWNISSDCGLVQEPVGIECFNGEVSLIYLTN